MKISVDVDQFLAIITYDGMLDGVSLINYPFLEQDLLSQSKEDKFVIKDHILWSTRGWIEECKRLKQIDDILEEQKRN